MQQENSEIKNLKLKCRICLDECKNFIDIFTIDARCGKIWLAIMECSSINVQSDDRLSSIICQSCLENLRTAYEFRSLCRLSDKTLHDYLSYISLQDKPNNTSYIVTNVEPSAQPTIIFPITTQFNSSVQQMNNQKMQMPSLLADSNGRIMNIPLIFQINEPPKEVPKTCANVDDTSIRPDSAIKEGNFCGLCSKEYNTKRQLKRHERVTHGERKFECTLCDKKFTEKSVLKMHVMAIHTDERPFKCSVCDKKYTAKNHLRIHMRSHTGERPYTCNICKKAFKQVNVLKEHKISHSGVRSVECNLCKGKFKHARHLRKHLKTVHNLKIHELQKK